MRRSLVFAVISTFALSLVLAGCAPKPKIALSEAEQAIAEAEATSAAQGCPEQYRRAQEHLEKGKEHEYYFRNQEALIEYEAARDAAREAISICGGGGISPDIVARTETTEGSARPEETSPPDSCCTELQICNSNEARLERKIENLRRNGVVRYIRQPCEERDEEPAPAATAGSPLLGTLLFEGPPAIVKGQADYEIKVKYLRARLGDQGAAAAEDDYRILLDVAKAEPADVEASSPTADFEPLSNEAWIIPVNVVPDTKGSVKVTIAAVLRNTKTGKEQELPKTTVTIPDLTSCPDCPKVPAAAVEAPPPKSDWTMRIILLVAGIVVGFVVKMLLPGKSKTGPSIKSI